MDLTQLATRAGLYLRRGSHVTPGVMTLADDTLTFATERETVFQASVERVSAVFSRFSTLTVEVDGLRYDFVTGGYAGAFAKRFSSAQLAELVGGAHAPDAAVAFQDGAIIIVSSTIARSVAGMAGSLVGPALASVGDAVGVVKIWNSHRTSFALARAWAEHLAANGVKVRMRGTTFAASQGFIAAIVIPALAVLGVGVYALVSALSSGG
jgi:hypothetical protein